MTRWSSCAAGRSRSRRSWNTRNVRPVTTRFVENRCTRSASADGGWLGSEALLAGPLSSRSTYAVSTAGAVRTGGFTLLPTYEAPHYDLLLVGGQYPEAERLLSLFSSPELNVYKRRGR